MKLAPFALGLALVLAACTSTSKDAPLIAAPQSPIQDVPIPAGFEMNKSVSTSNVIPALSQRFVDHQYLGSDDFLPVARFYKDQMPNKGWTLLDQSQGNATVTLHFTKNSEECSVTIKDGNWATKTNIRVKIDPVVRK